MMKAFLLEHRSTVFIFMMVLHCVIGLFAALLARKQGRPFRPWMGWGLLGGTVALVAVVFSPPRPDR